MKAWFTTGFGMLVLAAGTAGAQESSWSDMIKLKGDMRLRHETIDQDDKDDTRNRARMRVRLGLSAVVNETIDAHIRLASGSDDPVSSNVSTDGGFTTKDFRLDRAYLDWHPDALGGVSLLGGKMAQPWYVIKDLVWDSDLNPEGFSAVYEGGEDITLGVNVGAFFLEERSGDSDTMMYNAQLYAGADATETITMVGGLGYYQWDNMQGFATLFEPDDGFGNTTIPAGAEDGADELYVNDYGVFELFGKLGFDVGMPLGVYADYIMNNEATTDGDTGYMFGATLGKAKDVYSWQLDYNYRDLEADATVGAYVDSDAFGGGSNGKGHKISGKYQIAKNWQLAAAYFNTQLDPDGDDIGYQRFQLDLVAKF